MAVEASAGRTVKAARPAVKAAVASAARAWTPAASAGGVPDGR
jgi:hypothetical protein